jgi:hypothetical protein
LSAAVTSLVALASFVAALASSDFFSPHALSNKVSDESSKTSVNGFFFIGYISFSY